MVLIKLAFNEIKKRKLKCFLVFFSIMISILVIIISASFNDSVLRTRLEQFRNSTFNSQIILYSESTKEEDIFFNNNVLQKLAKVDNVQSLMGHCSYNITTTNDEVLYLTGLDIKKANEKSPFIIFKGNVNFSESNGVIISKNLADRYGLQIDSILSIKTMQGIHEFKVKCIAKDEGFFEMNQIVVICDIAQAQNLIGIGNRINSIDITIDNLAKIEDTVNKLSDIVKENNLSVRPYYHESDYNAFVTTIVLALRIFSIFSAILSLYILYSLFKGSVYENISEMATLRSIGLTIKEYRQILQIQNMFLFVSASICAFILSYPCLVVLLRIFVGKSTLIQFNYLYIIITVLVLFLFTKCCVYFSVNKISSHPLPILLNKGFNLQESNLKVRRNVSIGLTCIFVAIVIYMMTSATIWSVNSIVISIILLILGFIFLLNVIEKGFAVLLEKMFKTAVKSLGIVIKQFRFNIISYRETAVVISLVVLISTLTFTTSSTLNVSMQSVFNGIDIMFTVFDKDSFDSVNQILSKYKCDKYTIQKRMNDEVNDTNVIVAGVNINSYTNFNCETVLGGSRSEVFSKLNGQNTIIVSNTFLKNNNLKLYDNVFISGKKLKIVGIVSTFENMGKIIFTSLDTYNSIYVKDNGSVMALITTNTIDDCYNKLIKSGKQFENSGVVKIKELNAENVKQNKTIINMIYGLCFLMLIVSMIGFINNLIMYTLSRTHNYVIYRTLGASKRKIIEVAVIESLLVGISSTILGTLMGLVLSPIIIKYVSYYVGDMMIKINYVAILELNIIINILIILSTVYVFTKYVLVNNIIDNLKQK